jgi:hypothetical protein
MDQRFVYNPRSCSTTIISNYLDLRVPRIFNRLLKTLN